MSGKDHKSESVIRPAKTLARGNSASGKPPQNKRTNSDVANTTQEDITILSQQVESLCDDVKNMGDTLKSIMTKNEMEIFIEKTVEKIVNEMTKNMDVTISLKVDEKTKDLNKKISSLEEENVSLRAELKSINDKIKVIDNRSKSAFSMSNYNEQYSRKNNVKVMDIKESGSETEASLLSEVQTVFDKEGVTLDPNTIQAIHRIPGKVGHPKPVLIKFFNNTHKSKVMTHRSAFKSRGHRLVDDVTRHNVELIQRLSEHPSIVQSWYFNGSVYGKTAAEKRFKFDVFDSVDEVIKPKK